MNSDKPKKRKKAIKSQTATFEVIPTEYKSHTFRGRTEARWAVFFDTLGIRWEYEKEGYELPSGRYLPDFWLPTQGYWIEIKGKEPTEREVQLGIELSIATDSPVFIFFGPIPSPTTREEEENVPWTLRDGSVVVCFYKIENGIKKGLHIKDDFSWCYCDSCGAAAIGRNGDASWACLCDILGRKELGGCHKWEADHAYKAAIQYDFEGFKKRGN